MGVPARVTVPAGRTAAAFPIRTYQPDYIYGDFNVLITAKMRRQEISYHWRSSPASSSCRPTRR